MMIRDVFEKTKDRDWLERCLASLRKEYDFWMTKRISSTGLNHNSNNSSEKDKIESFLSAGKLLDKKEVTLSVKVQDLDFYNVNTSSGVVESGEFVLHLAASANDIFSSLPIIVK